MKIGNNFGILIKSTYGENIFRRINRTRASRGTMADGNILHNYIREGIYFDLFNCLYAIVQTATRAYHIVVFALELINL